MEWHVINEGVPGFHVLSWIKNQVKDDKVMSKDMMDHISTISFRCRFFSDMQLIYSVDIGLELL